MGFTSAQKIPDRWVATTCGYCSVGCGMLVGVKEGKAVSVRGNPDHPVNQGMLCPKGLSEHHTIDAETRAKYPLLQARTANCAGGMGRSARHAGGKIPRRSGKIRPETLWVILSTGQLVTEEFYTLGKLVQLGFGTKNYDGNTTLCMASAVSGYKRSFGSDGPPGAYEDLEKADVILLLGANVADNHPILCQRLEANKNKILIVADPRVTKTAMMADIFLPLKPRSDIALLNGLIYVLIENDLVDRDYIARHTTGFEALQESVGKYTPEYVSQITGLSKEAADQGGAAIRSSGGAVSRLDDGSQPQHKGHRNRQRDQQPCAGHRQCWPAGSISVFNYRAVQRDGHARSRIRFEFARLPQV